MISWAARKFVSHHARRVLGSMNDPHGAQLEAFALLRKTLAGSELALTSGFDACRTLDDCRALAPSDGLSMLPTLRKVFDGGSTARRALGRSRLHGFARTSGTRADPKIIPLNGAYLASLDRALVRMVCCHVYSSGHWDALIRGR